MWKNSDLNSELVVSKIHFDIFCRKIPVVTRNVIGAKAKAETILRTDFVSTIYTCFFVLGRVLGHFCKVLLYLHCSKAKY